MDKQAAPAGCKRAEFHWGEKTYVMGILNVSPDSFSGDGVGDLDGALARALDLVEQGADVLDIGGESTRPGVAPVTEEEELRRVVPVIERLAGRITVPISVDTSKSGVAERALAAGASIINDQWGLKKDPRLAELAAAYNVPIVLMSNQRGTGGGYDAALRRDRAEYGDVMAEITASLRASIEQAITMGVPSGNIIIDPGIGFGKSWQQEYQIIQQLGRLKDLDCPVLVGPSRKSFIGMVLGTPVAERLEGTAAVVAISIANGADIVRVHDVRQMVRVCRVSDAIIRRR
jgi:dihydropteroate synthase